MTEKFKTIWKNTAVVALLFGLTALNAFLCYRFVDFTPKLSSKFFFSAEDAQVQSERAITEEFGTQDQIILSCRGDIDSESYLARLESLTQRLEQIPGVFQVFSLSNGPKSPEYVPQSPLWQRILLPQEGGGSNIVVFAQGDIDEDLMPDIPGRLIEDVQQAADEHVVEGFEIVISGMPYIVYQMRIALARDFRVFSIAAAVVFAVLILVLIRSLLMVVGMLSACVNAGALTLLVTQAMGIPLSLLTANLTTIVFTLTLSHTVFLTFNWHLCRSSKSPAWRATKRTLTPSFWSMLTTLLGFMSLLFVQAEPLRKLGVSGAIGTVVAFAVAYLFHPWILWLSRNQPKKGIADKEVGFMRRAMRRPLTSLAIAGILVMVAAGTGIPQIQRDPSLLAYFAKDTPLRDGLEYVDHNLGSSPLNFVVAQPNGEALDNEEAFQSMWDLQKAFESDPTVGSVVSLPVIMAEAKKATFIGAILPWNWLVDLMKTQMAQNVASYFINDQKTEGLFTLLMHEEQRREPRQEVIDRLKQMVKNNGFEIREIGGVYLLQGRLTRMVISSLINGLFLLTVFIGGVVILLTRSIRLTQAFMFSVVLIPLWMLGIIGYVQMPFDIIAAPAVNLAISMGVDAMIHVLSVLRREAGGDSVKWDHWISARQQLYKPIFFSTIVVSAGFAIFALSAFPPTQRFGASIVLGTMMVPLVALVILPLTADWVFRLIPAKRAG